MPSYFRTARATRCTNWREIWSGVVDSTPNFNPIGAGVGAWGPKTENFTKIWHRNAPLGALSQGEQKVCCFLVCLFLSVTISNNKVCEATLP